MAGVGIFAVAFLVLGLLALALTVWVYSDEQENSPQSAALWALVTFPCGVLGLLAYFLVGRDTRHDPSAAY